MSGADRFAREHGVDLLEWAEPWAPTAHIRLDIRPRGQFVIQQLFERTEHRQPQGYPSQRQSRCVREWKQLPTTAEVSSPETTSWH